MPVRMFLSAGTVHDIKYGEKLIEGIDAEYLLADRGYYSNKLIEAANKNGIIAVIPPKKDRKKQRKYDECLYKLRHLVEDAFLHLKRWRGIAARYAKNASSFLAAVYVRCIVIWANVLA